MPRRIPAAALAALLFLLNAVLVRRLFTLEYSAHVGSIESAYISLSRYYLEHWTTLGWFPLWYGGIPWQNTYPPLLHVLVAAAAGVAGWTPALAHHAVTAFFYSLGPVLLFLLVYALSGQRRPAFVAAAIYSLFSLSAFLLASVRSDMGSVWFARRLHALVLYGEGPHVTSLALLPLAVLCLHLALSKGRRWLWVAVPPSMAAVVLTNWIGAFTLAAALLAYLLACQKGLRVWLAAGAAGLAAYALAAPLIPPSTIEAVRFNAQRLGGDYRVGLPQFFYWSVVLLLAGLLFLLFRRLVVPLHVRFAAYFLLFMAPMVLAADWFRFAAMPQPERYHLEMELPLAVLLGALLARGRAAGLALFAALAVFGFAKHQRFARDIIRPVEMERRVEYRVARWLDEHRPGALVMAPGNFAFWLNAFASNPQLSGGFDQGRWNRPLIDAHFQINSGMNSGEREGEVAVLWLKAYGARAVIVNGPQSEEPFKDVRNPRKYDGLLREIWRDKDDVIYDVPARSDSLAFALPEKALLLGPPASFTDPSVPAAYVAALEDRSQPEVEWQWAGPNRARMQATLTPEHAVSIHVTHHPGWEARADGRPIEVRRDGLGQIYLEPRCSGPCTLALEFTGGTEMRTAKAASAFAAVVGIVWLLGPRFRRK
ncbi:MAG: hypothetical protein SFV54_23910 [Bryobacteraceae bacterium]|nr:hypothetical protein [Bryobacteraceae bacterium]